MGIRYDIKMMNKVSECRDDSGSYGRLYFHTNENFDKLFENINFKDKKVLSVLGSSDHMFMAYSLGAKKVDVFDKNKLTLYYYYIRKWAIKYCGSAYPEMILNNDYKRIEELLKIVKVSSREEKKALLFWKKSCKNKFLFSSIFIDDVDTVPFKDIEMLKDIVSKDINFYKTDFFKRVKIKNKYDIIIFSNILEWTDDRERYIIAAKENLYKLLNEKGIVICSDVKDRMCESKMIERRIFDSNFSWKKIKAGIGYVYKKRDVLKNREVN